MEETKWIVASQNSPGIIYTVQKLLNNCECQIQCKECTICPHYYSCTCLDSKLHATVCKYIHLVHMNTITTISQTLEGNQEPSDNYSYFTNILSRQDDGSTIMSAKTTLISKLHELELLAEHCEDRDTISTANKHLQVAITVIKAIAQYLKVLLVKRKVSPNENSEHQ